MNSKDILQIERIIRVISLQVQEAYSIFGEYDLGVDDLCEDLEYHFSNIEGHIHDAKRRLEDG